MRAEISESRRAAGAIPNPIIRSDTAGLRGFVTIVGVGCAVLFVVIGLRYALNTYGDGSIFAYAVAVEDAWAFHWHNIAGRVFVYLVCVAPAEIYVHLTGDAAGGIVAYGLLFFAAPLVGLAATWAADRSPGQVLFGYACASTAVLCPLVFGFPTEMWVAHAVFWPALAVCHYARRGAGGYALVFALLAALMFTHGGGAVLAATILATLSLRGLRHPDFVRTAYVLMAIMPIWVGVHAAFPPDAYYSGVYLRAALHFFDATILTYGIMLLLFGALAGYAAAVLVLRRLNVAQAHLGAAVLAAAALAAYWLWFDRALDADHRYYLRTVLLIGTAALGALAGACAVEAEHRRTVPIPLLPNLLAALGRPEMVRAAAGAIAVVMLVHAVETAKFVRAWEDYKAAVRALAVGAASDPALGDARFVSSQRISADLNRMSWNSTTLFLSILVAPHFTPARLVVDPAANYFWLSCATAIASEEADRALPAASRGLVRVHACLHR